MANYYVGSGGSDANAGTSWGARKLTIQAAINVATTPGDNIFVAPGVYRETCTMGTSGTAGNAISLIGDYTGANTSGTKGVVRITGSADDIALTRANCITATTKNYITLKGFHLDLSSSHALNILGTCTNWDVSDMHITAGPVSNSVAAINVNYLCTSITIDSSFIDGTGCYSILAGGGSTSDSALVISNCVIMGGLYGGIRVFNMGGATVRNCSVLGPISGAAGIRGGFFPVGQVLTVNNCIVSHCYFGIEADATTSVVEDYNNVWACITARVNVTAGANSVARPPLFDTRWFFEMVNGGRMVTPFDLASYSTLVEYNSGTGAPATDLRGASVVGTYREWGALEHSANYRIQGPVSIAPLGGIG